MRLLLPQQHAITISSVLEGASHPKSFIPYLVNLFKQGELDILKKMITIYKSKDALKAFEDMSNGEILT